MTTEPDAWKQHDQLVRKFTADWEVRSDLRIVALACDRAVRLEIASGVNAKFSELPNWHDSGPRNVSTMRELAYALLEACDFVEKANPTWASHDDDIDVESAVRRIAAPDLAYFRDDRP